jgi:hypothetical protein
MGAELIAERTVRLAIGPVRLTVARHDDGHYSGVASLVESGQRIGLLAPAVTPGAPAGTMDCQVDESVAGDDVIDALTRLLARVSDQDLATLHE